MRARLFLALENRVLRESLTRLVRGCLRTKVDVYAVSTCAELLVQSVPPSSSDLLLTELPPASSPHRVLLRQALDHLLGIRILIVDLHEDENALLEAARYGAMGFLLRDSSTADVIAAVRALVRDEPFCPAQVCSALLKHVVGEQSTAGLSKSKTEMRLTRRQQEIVPLVSMGLSNKEIASELSVAEQTVKNHIHSMLRSTGAKDRLTLVSTVYQTNYSSQVRRGLSHKHTNSDTLQAGLSKPNEIARPIHAGKAD